MTILNKHTFGKRGGAALPIPYHQWDMSTLASSGGTTSVTDLQGNADLTVPDASAPSLANTDEVNFNTSKYMSIAAINTGAEVFSVYVNAKIVSASSSMVAFELSNKWNSNIGATIACFFNGNAIPGNISLGMRADGSTLTSTPNTGIYYFDNNLTFKKMLFEYSFTNNDPAVHGGLPYAAIYDADGLVVSESISAADGLQQTTYPFYVGARAGASLFAFMTLKGEMNVYAAKLTEDERSALLA